RQFLNRRRVRLCRQRFGGRAPHFGGASWGGAAELTLRALLFCPRGDPSSRNLTQVWRLFHRGGRFIPLCTGAGPCTLAPSAIEFTWRSSGMRAGSAPQQNGARQGRLRNLSLLLACWLSAR